jgi:hypothetical protein
MIKSPPRLVVEIDEKQFDELNKLIPWGVKGQIFRVIIDDLIRLLRTNPDVVVAAIVSKNFQLQDFPSFRKGED